MSSVPSSVTGSPMSRIPYMSHDKKFCKSSKSSASYMGAAGAGRRGGCGCIATGRSCCKPDRIGESWLMPASCCAALMWSHDVGGAGDAEEALQLMLGREGGARRGAALRARECSEMEGRVRSVLSWGLLGGLLGLDVLATGSTL